MRGERKLRRGLSKLFWSGFLIALAWPAWVDAYRLGEKEPPLTFKNLITSPFKRFAPDLDRSGLARIMVRASAISNLRQAAQSQIRAEPLTALAIPVAASGRTFDDLASLQVAHRVSRRNTRVQLQLATNAAKLGNLAGSMRYLDEALQVNSGLRASILPGLLPSLQDAQFRHAIRPYAHRPWFWQLATAAAASPEARSNAAKLFAELKGEVKKAPDGALPMIIRNLLAEGRARDAFLTALASEKITEKDLREFSPNQANSNPEIAPLSWKLAKNEAVTVSLGERNSWTATIEPGRTGTLLERVTLSSPGQYQAEASYAGEGDLTLQVSCVAMRGAELGRAVGKQGLLKLRFLVPPGCDSISWSISGSAASSTFPIEIDIQMPMQVVKI